MLKTLCFNFCFYLFISGTILFTILGVFAGSGNPALLIENSVLDKNNEPKEEKGLRKRVTLQYFIAAFLDLCFSLIFLYYILNNNKTSAEEIDNKIEEPKEPKEERIQNIKNEEQNELIPDINTNSINNEENPGMSEKY